MDDLIEFGPAMRGLTEKQRRFVLAMASDPFGNPTSWARAAGYAEVGANVRVKGHLLIHNSAIEAAAMEVARGTINAVGPVLATQVMLRAARNPKHPKQLRAAEMLANRVGLHEASEHTLHVNHSDQTGVALVERIKALAARLGVDSVKLLGVNTDPGIIEHEPFENSGATGEASDLAGGLPGTEPGDYSPEGEGPIKET